MYEQLENLIQLQELDREIQRLTREMSGIAPQIEASRLHLAASERDLEEGKARVDGARKDRRAAEKDLEIQIEKRRKFQEQQSKVKTNKEYQTLMGELAALKVEETTVEDQILAQMEQQADAEKLLPGLTAAVDREKLEFQQKELVLRGVEGKLLRELAAAEEVRVGIVATLDPATIQTYQRILKLRGSAVAEARDEFCLGCSTKVTAQNYMEVMRNDRIRHCPHCQRILFYLRPEVRPATPTEPESAA